MKKRLIEKMLALADEPGFEKLPPAEQDRRLEELVQKEKAAEAGQKRSPPPAKP